MSAQRAKGTAFETEALPELQRLWPGAERTGSASYAHGDYKGTDNVCVEAKNHKTITLAAFMDQVKKAAARSVPGKFPLLVIKRRGRNAKQAYAVMELQSLMDWMESERAKAYAAGQKAGPTRYAE